MVDNKLHLSGFQVYKTKERKDLLAKLPHGKIGGETHPFIFQGAYQHFEVYRIPIQAPLYNLLNTRTVSAQQQHLEENKNLDRGLFKDTQSIEAQLEQHQILKTLDSKSTERDLENNLKNTGQTEPLILDSTGVVWNGNRRLAKMRELNLFNSSLVGKFDDIKVVILPPCDEGSLVTLEAGLDIKKTGKEDFSWHSKALKIKNMVEAAIRIEDIMKMREMKKSEIIDQVAIINYVDDYLAFIKRPKIYTLIEKNKYVFIAMVKGMKDNKIKQNTRKMTFAKKQCYEMLREGIVGGSKYNKLTDFFKTFDDLYKPSTKPVTISPITGEPFEDPSADPQEVATPGEIETANEKRKKEALLKMEREAFRKKIKDIQSALVSSLNLLKTQVKHDMKDVDKSIIEIEATIKLVKTLIEENYKKKR